MYVPMTHFLHVYIQESKESKEGLVDGDGENCVDG